MSDSDTMKVAVIGGGPAGLATAWYLTRTIEGPTAIGDGPEVTVYQQGWRLGGKGAASRGSAGRIQEHGIHLFGNFYGNALGLIRAVYAELGRSLDDELLPNNLHMALHPPTERRFSQRVADVRNPSTVLAEDNIDPELLSRKLFESLVESTIGMTELPAGEPTFRQRLGARIRRRVARVLTDNVATRRAARYLEKHAPGNLDAQFDARRYEAAIRSVLPFRFVVPLLRCLAWISPRAEIRYVQADLLMATLRGVIDEQVFHVGIDVLDGFDHLRWLRCHGASQRTTDSAVARSVANICFQYPAGDTSKPPEMSAAAFVTFLLRQLAAPGPNFWYFRHGTGESVILPIYDALVRPADGRRAVGFEFFTRITDLVPGTDSEGRPVIEAIELRRHARPLEHRYDPVQSDGRRRFWPDRPILERLHPDDRQAIEAIDDLENWYELMGCEPGRTEVLRRGEHFDVVVLAVPPPAHPWTCPAIAGNDCWKPRRLQFIPTQAVQLWMADPGDELGLPTAPYRSDPERWSTAEWRNPYSCWVDFSDLVGEEDWPDPAPGSLFYFCGPLDVGGGELKDPTDPANRGHAEAARSLVREQVEAMLAQGAGLLPGSVRDGAFRYDRLVSPDGESSPGSPERLETQYLRANVVPTERYGLSQPGHLCHRPSPWESGYDNLVLAGDWVYTGLNINSFEGATISGALASYTIRGTPDPSEVIGYDFLRPRGGPRRPVSP